MPQLDQVGFDLGRLIRDNRTSTLGFGSEFRQVSELRPLLGQHPHIAQLGRLLTKGMHNVFHQKLSTAEKGRMSRQCWPEETTSPHNQNRSKLASSLRRIHGFSIPILIGLVSKIPGAMVQPLGLVQQWKVNPDGKREIKFRLMQDLSFLTDRAAEPTSINTRVDMSAYVEMIYGWYLPCILHYIAALRVRHPEMRILMRKFDYSDAYRRVAHSTDAATQTIAINGNTAYLSLRLMFRGLPNPPTWCMFSELVTDLANEIGQCAKLEPETLRSPVQPETPEPVRLPESVPIAQARQMAVSLSMSEAGGGWMDS